ncbi:MAG: hypothetical protein ABJG41_10265 [Cyclobacteriaceae bacterium]
MIRLKHYVLAVLFLVDPFTTLIAQDLLGKKVVDFSVNGSRSEVFVAFYNEIKNYDLEKREYRQNFNGPSLKDIYKIFYNDFAESLVIALRSGDLWEFSLDDQNLELIKKTNKLVTNLCVNNQGEIAYGTYDGFLVLLSKDQKTVLNQKVSDLVSGITYAAITDSYFATTVDGVIYKIRNDQITPVGSLDEPCFDIMHDDLTYLTVVATKKGIVTLDLNNNRLDIKSNEKIGWVTSIDRRGDETWVHGLSSGRCVVRSNNVIYRCKSQYACKKIRMVGENPIMVAVVVLNNDDHLQYYDGNEMKLY